MKKLLFSLTALVMLLYACMTAAFAESSVTSPDQLNQPGRKVGVSTGSAAMLIAEKELPNAEIVYFEDSATAYEAVAQGKIDAYVYDRRQMELAIASGRKDVHLLEENMQETVRIAVGISPVCTIPDFQRELNEFIDALKQDGTLDDMYERWVIRHDETMPDIPVPENPQYHLTIGTSGIVPPYSYYVGNALNGYDIELGLRFAARIGAEVTFRVYDYGAIVPAAVTGDVDCIMANLNVTPERAEALPFSEDLYQEHVGIMVRGNATGAPAGTTGDGEGATTGDSDSRETFLQSVQNSFNKTFIRENRWQLFVSGIIATLSITLLSILFGTLLGFGVYLLCRGGNPAAKAITRCCLFLVQGTPMVVLLMILYYLVFAGVNISGIAVAVFGFTLTFGASVLEMLKMGVGAVDGGQYEAAWALGYSKRRTFFHIILPQTLPHMLPAYRSGMISLIKATAVVGYIAVMDLTKMGDIVRSRTYEAFFPLIAVTMIYFVLEGLIGFAVSRIGTRLDPKKRDRRWVLKGVRTDDPH